MSNTRSNTRKFVFYRILTNFCLAILLRPEIPENQNAATKLTSGTGLNLNLDLRLPTYLNSEPTRATTTSYI